jgi:hypothetical protein
MAACDVTHSDSDEKSGADEMAARRPKKRPASRAKKRTASTAKAPLEKMDAAWQELLAKALEQHRAGAAKREIRPAAAGKAGTSKKKQK